MRFKSTRNTSRMPDINLVPMMDVVMTILTFFVVVSMTLTHQKAINIDLPSGNATGNPLNSSNPMLVELNRDGTVSIANQMVSEAELTQQMQGYLASNSNGEIVLRVDQTVPYAQVAQLLSQMQAVGGKQVSLAIDG